MSRRRGLGEGQHLLHQGARHLVRRDHNPYADRPPPQMVLCPVAARGCNTHLVPQVVAEALTVMDRALSDTVGERG